MRALGWKVQEGGDICIHIADSLCSAAETNTTLGSNYVRVCAQLSVCQAPLSLDFPDKNTVVSFHFLLLGSF